MLASRYPDWESFKFPAASPLPGPADAPVAFCADLGPASVLGAYRRGIIPMPVPGEYFRTLNEVRYEDQVAAGAIAVVGDERDDPYRAAWWSPDPRLLLSPDDLHLGRNVRERVRAPEGEVLEPGSQPRLAPLQCPTEIGQRA